ncbi:hypothetical protein PROFUN_03109 [Planoprotostelium fungivorum]|uniref:Uncharacterized protein n=1 Tax=Planoprotostelium fungivorum TaxID=1890364 RepID=A0A2P6NQ92_9EUKA|nr:hypothetical protein PROFUN_03109 [Planoprotostelium fungivorum]
MHVNHGSWVPGTVLGVSTKKQVIGSSGAVGTVNERNPMNWAVNVSGSAAIVKLTIVEAESVIIRSLYDSLDEAILKIKNVSCLVRSIQQQYRHTFSLTVKLYFSTSQKRRNIIIMAEMVALVEEVFVNSVLGVKTSCETTRLRPWKMPWQQNRSSDLYGVVSL